MIKYHRLGDLNNRNIFSHTSREYKSEIKVSTGLSPPRSLSLAIEVCFLPLSSWGPPSVCVCVLLSSSYKNSDHSKLGLILITSFKMNHPIEGFIS